MPCPFASQSLDLDAFYRRDLLKTALAVGGLSSLTACIEARGAPDVPQGTADRSAIPRRQYAWNEYLPRDPHGNLVFPRHQLILFFDYAGDGTPDPEERERVETALRSLERAYQRGNGGNSPYRPGGTNVPGLLFTLGYSRRYFDRFEADLPADVDLPPVESVLSRIDEPTGRGDEHDAAMVLVSDHVQVLLAVEHALFGRIDELNGVSMADTFVDVFEQRERRTGFIGPGVPRRELEMEEIPQQSPLGMGFISGFSDNQATEDAVAFSGGPFADGTTQHVSRLTLDLERWYEEDDETRVQLMFSTEHTPDDTGKVGELLASDSGLTREMGDDLGGEIDDHGLVGHTQKLARARDEEFEPLLLRRSEAISTGEEKPGFNFTSLQQSVDHFVETRRAMNGDDLDVETAHSGILDYIEVQSRGNYLVPPRRLAALPPVDPNDDG